MELTQLLIYLYLGVTSFINIFVPLSGAVTITPVLTLLADPHTALGIASFYFLLSAIIRMPLFWRDIEWGEVRLLFLPQLIAAAIGAYTLVAIPETLLLIFIFCFALYFLLKRLGIVSSTKKRLAKQTGILIGIISGFIQGAGFSGSSLRAAYLFGNNLSVAAVHGTTAPLAITVFATATIVRLFTQQVTIPHLLPLLYVFPFMLIAMLLGRNVLYKMDQKWSDRIVVTIMVVILLTLLYKILGGII